MTGIERALLFAARVVFFRSEQDAQQYTTRDSERAREAEKVGEQPHQQRQDERGEAISSCTQPCNRPLQVA